jgi:hypothetical protein
MLSGAFALRLLAHGTCRAARRVVWRPPPGAQLLATRALKMADKGAGGKQASIASFFGGGAQPKRAVATAAASPSASGGAKRAADDATTVAGACLPARGAAAPRPCANSPFSGEALRACVCCSCVHPGAPAAAWLCVHGAQLPRAQARAALALVARMREAQSALAAPPREGGAAAAAAATFDAPGVPPAAGAAGELKEGAANGDAKPKVRSVWAFLHCAVCDAERTPRVLRVARARQAFKRLRKPAGAAADAEPAAKADSGAAGASDAVAGGSADAPVAAAAAAEPPAARALAASAVEDEEALRPSGGASAVAQALADSEDELAEEEEEEEEEDAEAAAAAAKSKGKGKASAAAKKRPAAKAKAEGGAAGVGGKSLVAAAEYLKYAPLKAAEGMWKVRARVQRCAALARACISFAIS